MWRSKGSVGAAGPMRRQPAAAPTSTCTSVRTPPLIDRRGFSRSRDQSTINNNTMTAMTRASMAIILVFMRESYPDSRPH